MSRMRQIRESMGMSQKEMADRVGVALITLRQWESGRRIPRYRNASDWATALDMSTAEVFETCERLFRERNA